MVAERESQYLPNVSASLMQIKSAAIIMRESIDAGHGVLDGNADTFACCHSEIEGNRRPKPDIRSSARSCFMRRAVEKR